MVSRDCSRDNKTGFGKNLAIELTKINKSFGNINIFNDLNISISKKTIFALVGHNGAGKTTMIRIMLGLLKCDSGIVTIDGKIGALLENDYLFENLSCRENINMFTRYFKVSENDKKFIIEKYIKTLSLEKHLDKKVNAFSKGMKRKLSLLITLLINPDILILDEPTSGVDPKSRIEIRDLLKELITEEDKTILITSHDLSEIGKTADKIAIVQQGKIITILDTKILSKMVKYEIEIENIKEFKRLEDMIGSWDFYKKDQILYLISDKTNQDVESELSKIIDIKSITKLETNLEDIYLEISKGI